MVRVINREEFAERLELVLEMAKERLEIGKASRGMLQSERIKQSENEMQDAIDTIEDFIVNELGDE